MAEQPVTATMQSVDQNGDPADLSVLEDAGVAFDPMTQHLDLSKEEKRRTTALMMAIQAYQNLIIKDAEMLREVDTMASRSDNDFPAIKPATIDAMVIAALKFDSFIGGHASIPEEPVPTDDESETSSK